MMKRLIFEAGSGSIFWEARSEGFTTALERAEFERDIGGLAAPISARE